ALRGLRALDLPPTGRRKAPRPRPRGGEGSARRPRPPPVLGDDGRARRDPRLEHLLPDDDLLLLLRVRGARGRDPGRVRAAGPPRRLRITVLTTSYPRSADDVSGVFIQDAVERLRRTGHDITVVSPASFRHFGIANGYGIPGNLRRRPWLALLLPFFVGS